MSFLVDPPLLVGAGAAIGRLAPTDRSRRGAEAAVLAGFMATSISLYVDARWTRRLWEPLPATSGRDWMINSGVFGFEHRRPGPGTHVVAASLFATYPLWLRLGVRLGRRDGEATVARRRNHG